MSFAAEVAIGSLPLLNSILAQAELLASMKVGMAVTGVTPVGNT